MKKNPRPKTIFCDIDGTLVKQNGNLSKQLKTPMELLPGTIDRLTDWDRKGYNIILTTGRRECMRKMTEEQLAALGIFYDLLIMGLGGGERVLINDKKPNSDDETAFAFSLKRNLGLEFLKNI